MSRQEESHEALLERIKTLESNSRKLQIVCTLLLIIGALALYQNFKSQYQILDMNGSLNLRDDLERSRAILHAEASNSGLTLYDEHNQDRAMFGASRTGSGLTLRDQRSNQRIILRVNNDGPEILMTDNRGVIRFRVSVDEGEGRMTLYDQEGKKSFDSVQLAQFESAGTRGTGPEGMGLNP